MLFLRSLIDFPSTFHRLSIEFASNLHRICNGGSLEVYWRILPITKKNFAYNKENLLNNTAHCTSRKPDKHRAFSLFSAVCSVND